MQLYLMLPVVKRKVDAQPTTCPKAGCGSTNIRKYQRVAKPVKDTHLQEVQVWRYRCRACGRTFRVYPYGITHAPTSQRMQLLAVLLYALGLSYNATSQVLDALKIYMSKSSVHGAVRCLKQRMPLTRARVFGTVRLPIQPGDVPYVRCCQQWLGIQLVSLPDRDALTIDMSLLTPLQRAGVLRRIIPILTALEVQPLLTPVQGAA